MQGRKKKEQDEFYFSLPYDKIDIYLYAKNMGIAAGTVAAAIGLKVQQVKRVFEDIEQKRRATRYLHLPALLIEDICEIQYR